MSYDYSENLLVQESAGHLLERELCWEVAYAYNTEQLGKGGTNGAVAAVSVLYRYNVDRYEFGRGCR